MTAAANARAFVAEYPDIAEASAPPLSAEALALLRSSGFPRLVSSLDEREPRQRAARVRAAEAADVSEAS
jgi:hypothetical protein